LHLVTAQASTDISGILNSDTTWTKANSPYNLTGNVLVENGVTVTVEADAVVNLNGRYIRVNGTLIVQEGVILNMGVTGTSTGSIQVNGALSARGTSAQPIRFKGAAYYWDSAFVPPSLSSVSFATSSLSWNEQTGLGCIIENAVMDKTGVQIGSSIKFSDNQLSGAGIAVTGGSPLISNNVMSNGVSISISRGSPTIASNQLNGGYIRLYGDYGIGSPIIANNTISNSDPQWPYTTSAGISVAAGSLSNNVLVLIEKNIIKNSHGGIEVLYNGYENSRNQITIQNNTLADSEKGIALSDQRSSSTITTITYNNIYSNNVGIFIATISPQTIINNNIYDNNASIKLSWPSNDINATLNWWGTADAQAINQTIYDFKNDFTLGTVNFVPFLTAPNQEAMPEPNPSVTPTPLPTSAPSQTPTNTNSPSPTQQPTASTSQTVEPTFTPTIETYINYVYGLTAAIIVLIIAFIGLLIYLRRAKKI